MQLPLFRRLTEEDLADAPKGAWKGRLLYAVNLFIQQIYTGLSNNLTPEQNDIVQTKTFILIGSSTPENNLYSFSTKYVYPPLGRDVLSVQRTDGTPQVFTAAPYVSWNYVNGTFNVLGITGLTDAVSYTITIRVWWSAIVN